ncbi:MAG: NifB/NifX family molybdenum-iron cluster-binding protein [Candidatus Margulisiibacteriota bacterium]
MIICVSAQDKDPGAKVDPRFGRCSYFMFFDTETGEFEAVKNPNLSANSGAGPQSAQLVSSKGAKKVLTGNVGPNALGTLTAAGIEVLSGISGTVKEAIEKNK